MAPCLKTTPLVCCAALLGAVPTIIQVDGRAGPGCHGAMGWSFAWPLYSVHSVKATRTDTKCFDRVCMHHVFFTQNIDSPCYRNAIYRQCSACFCHHYGRLHKSVYMDSFSCVAMSFCVYIKTQNYVRSLVVVILNKSMCLSPKNEFSQFKSISP